MVRQAITTWPYCPECRKIIPWTEVRWNVEGQLVSHHEKNILDSRGMPTRWRVCAVPILHIRILAAHRED